MRGIPAYCKKCNQTFITSAITVADGLNMSNATFIDCIVPCDYCGGPAHIIDGLYSAKNGDVQIDGTIISQENLRMLRRLAETAREKAREAKITSEEFITDVAGISPELAQKLRDKHSLPIVFLIALLFLLVRSCAVDVKVDLNRSIDQVMEIWGDKTPDEILDDPALQLPPEPIRPSKSDESASSYTMAMAPVAAPGRNRKERRKNIALSRKG